MKPQALTETALFSALAIILSYIIIFRAPQGGSISLVMAPILIISLKQGVGPGVFCGVVTGAITFMFGGFFVAPLQVVCDYLLAYGAIGLAGLFSRGFLTAMRRDQRKLAMTYTLTAGVLAGGLRLFFHTLAGIAFYTSYAPKGQPVWLYSLIYNSLYVIPDTILAIICVLLLTGRLKRVFVRG
ncbi:energy-coupled thiamine transporter ThiT [Levilactobacillus sp. HBUAS70063]|uniref:energy-coupled thiamine transporter ThiT n=1 Tax=Levilactobacillus sp. HBUAS70063 TaxID=3109359 RepID=UPI0031333E88